MLIYVSFVQTQGTMKHAFQPTCPYFTFHSDQMQKKRYDQVSNLLDYKSNT